MRPFASTFCCAFVALVMGCGGRQPIARDAPGRTLDAETAQALVESMVSGGSALDPWLAPDAWMLHHGSTGSLRGKGAIVQHLATIHAAYPGLLVEIGRTYAIEQEGWGFEATLRQPKSDARGELFVLLRQRRGKIVSLEVFGDDPRTLGGRPDSSSEPHSEPVVLRLETAADRAPPDVSRWIADRGTEIAGAEPRLRMSATDGVARLSVLVIEARPKAPGLAVRHHLAVVSTTEGEEPRVYANPREGGVFEMSHLTLDHQDRRTSRLDHDTLYFSAWEAYCCEHGTHPRACRLIDATSLRDCNAQNRLAISCRQAYHCVGTECFCCESGLDAACEMDGVAPPEREVPDSKRPAASTIWSPY